MKTRRLIETTELIPTTTPDHAAAPANQELQGEDSMPAKEAPRVFTADETQEDISPELDVS